MKIVRPLHSEPHYLKALLIAVLTLSATVLSTAASNPDTQAPPAQELHDKAVKSCGPMALQTALSLLGRSVSPLQCAQLAGTNPNGITTLAGLKNAAQLLGEHTIAMHLMPHELALLNQPAILHVSVPYAQDHFVVFFSSNGPFLNLIDPIQSDLKNHYTAEQLRLMWNGDCLVFTANPLLASLRVGLTRAAGVIAAAAGLLLGIYLAAALTTMLARHHTFSLHTLGSIHRKLSIGALGFFTTVAVGASALNIRALANDPPRPDSPRFVLGATPLNIGDIPWGRSFQTSIWVANTGRRTLKIDKSKIKRSCSCLGLAISKLELPAGHKEELRIRLTPPHKLGAFRHWAFIPSNDPQQKGQVLVLNGQVTGPAAVVYPPRLYFHRVTTPQTTRKSLLYIVRRPGVEILNVTSDRPFVLCSYEPTSRGSRINVSLTELPKHGPFDGNIKIATNDPEPEHAEIIIPFCGTVEQSADR